MKHVLVCFVCICLLFGCATGCTPVSTRVAAEDLMNGITPRDVEVTDRAINGQAMTPFAVELLKHSYNESGNTVLSPLSVFAALAMTANGADGETREQIEAACGMTVGEMNEYLLLYRRTLPNEESVPALSLANAIWYDNREELSVEPSFLQTNADYFGAEIRKAPFDGGTVKDINEWVNRNTDGIIPNLVDELPKETVMCLLNALAFNAEWEEPYEELQVRDGTFTTADGAERSVDMMYSAEANYLDDGKATGFVKYYKGRKYAFATLLPNEGVSMSEYVSSLTGDGLYATLSSPTSIKVYATMPRFDTSYQIELDDALKKMGVTDAFDVRIADFSAMGSYEGGNLYIGRVLHKARMSVNERGTRAGAVAAVLMDAGAAIVETREVILDRPFVYVLFDCETNLPIFLGVMNDTQ